MADPKKAPDPVVAPPPPKVSLVVQVVDGFGLPLRDAEVEVVNLPGGPKKPSGSRGLADFGLVDPRRKFDIKVRKTSFGPPGNPFTPGENRVVRRPNAKSQPIVVPLTQNLAKLRVRVLTPAPGETPIPAAIVGIDGITGAPPLPQTDASGNSQLFTVPPGPFRFHAQKNGFGPEPVGANKFQRDQEVVGTRTLVDGEIATEVLHLTRFVARLTIRVVSPPAAGGLPGPDVPLDDAEVGVDGVTGPGFQKTKDGGKVTVEIPAGQDFHVRARKNGFGRPSSSGDVVNFSFDEADVTALAENEEREVTLRLAEAGQVTPVITPIPPLPADGAIVVLVKKPHTKPKRWQINVKGDVVFGGTGVLRVANPSGAVKVFRSATGVDELPFDGKGEIAFTTPAISASGTDLFIEAAAATTKVADLTLTLELRGGTKFIRPPVSIKVTCVDLTLDICKSRTSATVDPEALTAADKINVGRLLHRQVNNKHGRAMLIVRKPSPADFAGTLTLKPIAPAGAANPVLLFASGQEVPAAGQLPLGNPHDVAATFDAANPPKFFAEGGAASGAFKDTGFTLGIKGVDEDQGDRVAITVVAFSSLKASVPTTPENQTRTVPALGPNTTLPARTDLTVGSGAVSGFEEDFFSAAGTNTLVLLENSIKGAGPPAHFIELSASVTPNVPEVRSAVKWKARRDTRAAPLGDNPNIATLAPTPNPRPTVTQLAADPLKATMLADSVGSFHVALFVDANGNGEWDFNDATTGARIDREPFIVMCFILVRAQAFQNASVAQDANATFVPAAPTSASGVGFSSGGFGGPAVAGVHNDATITLIGGGRNGRLGLDRVFGGWVNGIPTFTSIANYQQTPPAPPPPAPAPPPVNHQLTALFAANAVGHGLAPGPIVVTRFVSAAAAPAPLPANMSTAAPVPLAPPLLDCTNFGNEGTGGNRCVGTEGGVGPPLPTPPVPLPSPGHDLPVGEDRRIQMFDSPGFGASPAHPVLPGQLTSFNFNVDFRCDLCLWTNIASPPTPNPTNDPACRLYVTVLTNRWFVRFNITFNLAAGGAGTPSPRPFVTMTPEVVAPGAARLARAIDRGSEPVEVRFPIAVRAWSLDGTT